MHDKFDFLEVATRDKKVQIAKLRSKPLSKSFTTEHNKSFQFPEMSTAANVKAQELREVISKPALLARVQDK